jgi:tRNA nucleotidyltransferase (CCA-adding enzyme)
MMAKRAHVYPQVEPGAAALADVVAVRVARGARAADALRHARARHARVVVVGGESVALREDLARASLLGLGGLPARVLARPLPVVDARASEIAIRRALAEGAPMVVVRDRGRVVGAVAPAGPPGRVSAVGARVADALPPALRQTLARIGRVTAGRDARAFVVGGLVRDLLRGRIAAGRDLDIVIEGDAIAAARAAAVDAGVGERAVVVHERFLTASVDLPDLGRVDFATARAERYERPGALPRVMPASIDEDLARRDFTVNALALELGPEALTLIDRFGGRADLAARRLRVLHPLSFVEDPTRIFRCARYAARLRFLVDAWTARAMTLALNLVPYPALSGGRLVAELELIARDIRPAAALRALGRAGAFRLVDSRYRFTPATDTVLGRLPAALAWAVRHALRISAVEIVATTLLSDQVPAVRRAALRRLGLSGEPLVRIERALDAADVTVAPGGSPAARARALRRRSDAELLGLWLLGDERMRAVVDWYLGHARAARPSLGGDELIALGVPAGPAVGRLLDELRDARLDGRIDDRDGELRHVRHWVESNKEE